MNIFDKEKASKKVLKKYAKYYPFNKNQIRRNRLKLKRFKRLLAILQLRYQEGFTCEKIGKKYNLTHQAVSLILRKYEKINTFIK